MKSKVLPVLGVASALLLQILLPASLAAADSDPVELKLNWEVGKRYLMSTSMKQVSEINIPGMPDAVRQHMEMQQEYAIHALKERPGGGRDLEMEFTALKMVVKLGEVPVLDFDSKNKDQNDSANPTFTSLRKVLGARIQYSTDARGEILEVRGAKELAQAIATDDAQTEALMQGMFNEDSLKQMYAFTKMLPPKPVKIGDTWPVKIEVKAGPIGTIEMTMNHLFKGWEQQANRKTARLDYTGTISAKPGTTSPEMGEVSIKTSKMAGKSWFDPAVGMVVEGSGEHEMIIKFSPAGQEITTKVTQQVANKLLDISARK